MRRPFTLVLTAVAAVIIAFGNAQAQQTPPAKTPETPAAKTSPKPPAAKPGSTTAKKPAVLALQTQKDKASYAIGLNIGRSMHKGSVDIDPNILLRGLKDGLAGAKPLLTDDEAKGTMVAFEADLRKNKKRKSGAGRSQQNTRCSISG
jgi:hypothetical protein